MPSDKELAQNQAANQDPDDDEDMFGNIFDAAAFGIDEAEVGHLPGVPDGAAAAGAAVAAAAGASAPAASDDAGPAPEASAEASAELLFHAALVIPGALHILHSAAGEITDALEEFATYLQDLRLIVDLLSHAWMRDRFMSTCLECPGAVGYRHLFVTMPTLSLAEWRWGHLFHCVSEVVLRMTPLRLFWSESRMTFQEDANGDGPGGNRRAHPAAETQRNLRSMTEVITSNFFWAYTFILRNLGMIVKDFELYCYSCNCHPERTRYLYSSDEPPTFSRLFQLLSGNCCVMMGRLAPNFAVGEWKGMFDTFANARSANVLEHCCGLSVPERTRILSEFGKGRSRLLMTIELKFGFFGRLPHKILGCAHDDEDVARVCAEECHYLYEALLKDSGVKRHLARSAPFHPLIHVVFIDLEDLFVAFAFGNKKRSECGLLAKVFTGLRLVILLEVSVKGKRALAKLRARQRKRASPEMFNFELLIGEVQQWLRVDRNIFYMLASNYERVHANAHLLAKFEMLNHPYIQESIQQWGRLGLPDISVAFLHCDPHSQYKDHSNLTHNGSHLEDKLPTAKETRPERTPERVFTGCDLASSDGALRPTLCARRFLRLQG